MWPWAHAALGYLLYRLVRDRRELGRPLGPSVITLVVGTQLPDLIDKPLAWYVHVLPYGRSFAHSLLTGVPLVLVPVAVLLARRGSREAAIAFAVGYLSHLLGDGYLFVLQGEWAALGYLAWPLFPLPSTEVEGLVSHFQAITAEPHFLFGLALTGLATGVWLRDGRPGVATLRTWAGRVVATG
jgi:hypothetical protein